MKHCVDEARTRMLSRSQLQGHVWYVACVSLIIISLHIPPNSLLSLCGFLGETEERWQGLRDRMESADVKGSVTTLR